MISEGRRPLHRQISLEEEEAAPWPSMYTSIKTPTPEKTDKTQKATPQLQRTASASAGRGGRLATPSLRTFTMLKEREGGDEKTTGDIELTACRGRNEPEASHYSDAKLNTPSQYQSLKLKFSLTCTYVVKHMWNCTTPQGVVMQPGVQ